MILLFGGTSECAALATALADAGYPVLVSTATDAELNVGTHRLIERRCGRLDAAGMAALVLEQGVRLIVDSAHPFAVDLHQTVQQTAEQSHVPLIRYQRRFAESYGDKVLYVDDHNEAAVLAASFNQPVLLTTGSRNLVPYIDAVAESGVPLFARVLDHPDSVAACDQAGLLQQSRIYGRGPFSYEDNTALIRQHGIRALVSKDSGAQGGVDDKVQAALDEGCHVILIRRPEESGMTAICQTPAELVDQVIELLGA